jgi:hypothetical protein
MKHANHAFTAGALACLCVALPADAYVGPGAGITLIGAVIGLVSAIFLALFAVLRWPIRRYLARRKAAKESSAVPSDGGPGAGSP